MTDALSSAFQRTDLVVSTGGPGPTPDDLTRESIAAALNETVEVDPDIEAWLRERWERRGLPFPEMNLKQAWRIPSCEPLPNPNGSAPGWFVSRPDAGVRGPARATTRDAADVDGRGTAATSVRAVSAPTPPCGRFV